MTQQTQPAQSPTPAAPPSPEAEQASVDQQTELVVTGMTCASCAARVEKRLNKLDGVTATVNFATEKARVHSEAPVPVEELEQDLEQYITLGSTGCRTIAEDVEFNRLHSKFLAAFRKAAE